MDTSRIRRAALIAVCALGTIGAAAPALRAEEPSTIPSNEEIFSTIQDVVSFSPRRVGTPGIEQTVDYIVRKFQEYGLKRVHIEETPTASWDVLAHSLSFGGRDIPESPVIYSQSPSQDFVGDSSTPPGGLKAPLVDAGLATAAEINATDVKGKIVVFDLKFLLPIAGLLPDTEFLWDPEQTMALSPPTLLTANPFITTYTDAVKAAQDGGAVGFVGVLSDYFDSNRYYNERYRRQLVSIPGMWVTKAEGERLRAQMAAQPDGRATLVMRTRRAQVPSHVVVGFLDGKSTDAIQIQSHHDSGFQGAVEDASGVSEVLALARHYSRQPAASRNKTLMFTTFDSHWSGYSAHQAFLKRHVAARVPARDPNRIVANVTLEHIAKHALRGPLGELEVSELPEPRGIFETLSAPLKTDIVNAVVGHDLRRTAVLNGSTLQPVGIPTDASGWVILGVPTVSFISGPLYLYDAADTVDKVLKDELNKVAATFIQITDAIDAAPSDRLSALPAPTGEQIGKSLIGDVSVYPDSTDRLPGSPPSPNCGAAPAGRAVKAARVLRLRRGLRLRFTARRTLTLRARATLRGGRHRTLRTRRIIACHTYRVALPRRTQRVQLRWADGRATVRVARR